MSKLQILALVHIEMLAKELDKDCIRMGGKLIHGEHREEFNLEKHSFPLAEKARVIERWANAILESNTE